MENENSKSIIAILSILKGKSQKECTAIITDVRMVLYAHFDKKQLDFELNEIEGMIEDRNKDNRITPIPRKKTID